MALDAATSSGLVPVHETFHRFEPHGVTGLVLLAESHLSVSTRADRTAVSSVLTPFSIPHSGPGASQVHTWPQFGYAAIDAYACNETGSLAHGADGEGGCVRLRNRHSAPRPSHHARNASPPRPAPELHVRSNPWRAARKLAHAIGAEGTRVAWLERGIPATAAPQ